MKIFKKINWLSFFSLLFLALFGVKALFHAGFYTNHDGEHQVVRLWHFHQAINDGQFPVRWAGTALNNFGYPLFIFTYQLPFWIGEIFYRFGLNLTDSIKAVFILTFLASGITMYFFAKDFWKSRLAGFLSAFFYLWAPYRFSNIFVRASLGEHVVFVFLPLIFWGLWRLQKEQKPRWILVLALGIAGAILSHLLVFQLLLLPLLFFVVALFFKSEKKKKFLLFSFLGFLLGFGLSSYYLLPALEGKKIILSLYPLSFSEHFPTLRQLFYSPWGYTFSVVGEQDGMAFQIGLVHWLIIFLSVIFLIVKLFSKRKKLKPEEFFALCLVFLYFFSIVLMLKVSYVFWKKIVQIVYLDFPWRMLFISVFLSSLLSGFVIIKIKENFRKFLLVSFLLFFGLNLYVNRNHLRVNKYVFNPDSFYQENKGTTNSFNEYTPRWAISSIPKIQQWDQGKIVITKGKGSIKINKIKSNFLSFKLENKENVDVVIANLYYPGWEVFINNGKKEINYLSSGFLELEDIKPGKSEIQAFFRETTSRKIANLISLVSLFLTFLICFRTKRT